MRKTFRISEKANEDLEKIWLYTLKTWSLKQADRNFNLLTDEIEYISTHFDSGKDMNQLRKGYRASRVKLHIAFYRKAEDEITEVIRILHQRMDIENRLKE